MLGANVDLLILVVFILQYYITSYTVTLKAKFYQFCLNLVGGIRFGPLVQFSFGTLLAGQLMNKNVCLKILDRYLGGPQIWT